MSSTAAKTPCIDLDEDLEDGEIDDDDDDEVVVQQSLPLQQQHQQQQKQPKSADEDVQFVGIESLNQNIDKSKDDDVVFLGQSGEGSNNTIKTKKPRPLEDDHAVSIENAIANALKKRGIEPPMPKMRSMYNNSTSAGGRDPNDVGGGGVGVGDDGESGQYLQQQTASRNSRRRKRKKERERKQKKDKDHQKRARHDDEEETPGGAAAGGAASDEMDMDEYEMMNVRGGSPPPGGATVPGNPYMGGDNGPGAAGGYDSLQDYYSSYDSYSDDDMAGGGMNQRRRQRHDRDKDNQRSGNSGRKRRDRDQDRRHDAGGGNAAGGAGSNKRNRRDSGDGPMNNEKMMRTEPRKLELCKFYLMDCCAKRDKCSYMHKEFPCKYYYLGMECYAGEDCLFHHGEPLSEQLRNILLKHMETAPKEILGDFKRIGRDVALAQMTRRHEQLCEQYGRDNSWTTMASAGIGRRRPGDQGQQDQQQQQLQQQLQQQQQLLSTSPLGGSSLEGVANQLNNTAAGQQLQQQLAGGQIIPSLLDMVINRPQINESKTEKKRKSRWAEKTAAKAAAAAGATGATATTTTTAATSTTTRSSNSPAADIVTGSSNLPPATTAAAAAAGSKSLPPHLDLVNLTNVLSAEHMAKLNKLGITNLEQMLEVPFGQLTEVGLTLNEIGEIQQKAEAAKPTESKALTTTTTTTSTTNSSSSINPPAKSETTEANSNSNSNGFIMVDYTQYLKDAHVNFSANDPLDDDRDDDEQLVIDDGNDESAAEEEPKVKSTKPEQIDNETPPLPSVFDLPSFMSNMIGGGANKAPEHQAAETADDDKKANKDGDDGTGAAAAPSTSSSLFSRILFGEKQPDPEARAAFYRDIIRNPFKAHQGDIGDDQPNENSNSNSRSMTPTPTPTPEPGSQSPQQLDEMSLPPLETPTFKSGGTQQSSPLYARTSMYDFDSTKAEQQLAALQKANDQASNSERDIDMRLPFEPMKHYMPATEIDAAIFSHTPLRWQLQEVDVEEPNYVQLRLSAAHKEQRELRDPRVRRILGLTELTADGSCGSGASGGGGASANLLTNSDSAGRGSGNTISSPDSVIMSPMARDTTPTSPPPSSSSTTTTSSSATSQVFSSSTKMVLPAMNVPPPTMGIPPPNLAPEPQVRTDPRRDPRRAHLNASSNTANTSNSSSNSSSSISTNSSSTSQTNPSGGSKQILEIRNLMQSSNWYKNLGSNNKIMVNQQLALVFTELKKFHQQEGNNKIFDLNFIVNNSTLQQIFAKLYIYIDDMGQVVQLPEDLPTQGVSSAAASSLILPNLSQPPPNMVQMLRQPPPNMCGNAPGGGLIMQMGMPPPTVVFNQPPPSRPRLLGMGPGGGNGGGGGGNGGGGVGGGMPLGNNNNNLFNPFSGGGGGNGGNMGMGMPFMNNGGGGGGMPYKNFNNNGGGPGGNGGGNGGGGHHHFSGGGNNRNQRGNGPRNHRNNI
ncbi:protein suppressor of sable isoform X2 [Drosophila willistoni]|uniref:protein suppressor of sable isoform X2 n=1 Tax=Drosophila willistoni TaxID=7260 RepID=UPI001F07F8C0|nr:protein suppressor of sable isoform X2 [Drosophila willistoni]